MEYLEISECPKCKGRHRYALKVERDMVIKMLTMSPDIERQKQVNITRLFTCPKTNDDFQATFSLTQWSSARIKDVRVVGIAEETDDAK